MAKKNIYIYIWKIKFWCFLFNVILELVFICTLNIKRIFFFLKNKLDIFICLQNTINWYNNKNYFCWKKIPRNRNDRSSRPNDWQNRSIELEVCDDNLLIKIIILIKILSSYLHCFQDYYRLCNYYCWKSIAIFYIKMQSLC